MAAVPATVRTPGGTVEEVADATTAAMQPRTWAIDEEVIELVKLDSKRRGVRYYSNRGSNAARTYNVLRKRLAAGGDGTITKPQLVRDLYPGRETWEDAESVVSSVRRWLRLLESVGLIRCEALTVGTGKFTGIRYELLDVAAAGARMGATRGCSSVGSSVSSQSPHSARKRRLPKKVREAERVRRGCPRAGRGATPAYVDEGHPEALPPPARPFFSPWRFASTGGPQIPPTGVSGDHQGADARARKGQPGLAPPGAAAPAVTAVVSEQRCEPAGAALTGSRPASLADRGRGIDAIERACPPAARAALGRLRSLGTEGGALALRNAGADPETPWIALALAAWATFLPDVEPRCSIDTADRIERSARQLARFWSPPDVASFIVGQLEDLGPAGVDPLSGNVVGTIKVLAIVLRQTARRARRHATSRPAPRPHRARGDGWL